MGFITYFVKVLGKRLIPFIKPTSKKTDLTSNLKD